MSKIKEDCYGLYSCVGGYISRPKPVLGTRFKKGDDVKSFHFGGSTEVGVGKDATTSKGQYLEYWTSTGISSYYYGRYKKEISTRDFERWLDAEHTDAIFIACYGFFRKKEKV